ncbi:NUDIX hydrolase [Micromonospora sp. NPDC047527]|uniref:NUDIX hydrolase n=1 Tax=Micromonospora sp. NPDC047527 TaxID=3155144 RepID=UPI0033CE5088
MTDERPLYERDPVAWRAHLAEGNAKQARKRVGADVLIRNALGDVLLVNPRYKPDWDLPGGMVEANEPPDHAAEREVREELGLHLRVGALLVIDWVAPHGPWDDSLMFVFNGGTIAEGSPTPQPLDGELLACQFTPLTQARSMLRPYLWDRLDQAVAAALTGAPRYLTNGRPRDSA